MKSILPVLLLAGCAGGGPDYSPIGAGLSVIGLAIVIAATIKALLRGKGGRDE